VSSDIEEELSDTNNVVLPVTLPFLKVEGQVSNSRIQYLSVWMHAVWVRETLSLSTTWAVDFTENEISGK
jgi:hypothetical protein